MADNTFYISAGLPPDDKTIGDTANTFHMSAGLVPDDIAREAVAPGTTFAANGTIHQATPGTYVYNGLVHYAPPVIPEPRFQSVLTNLNYKEKPKQFGPFSVVQGALRDNVEKIGIDYEDVALAMPMWGPGDQQDYSSKHETTLTTGTFSLIKNELYFDGSQTFWMGNNNPAYNFNKLTSIIICKNTTSALYTDVVFGRLNGYASTPYGIRTFYGDVKKIVFALYANNASQNIEITSSTDEMLSDMFIAQTISGNEHTAILNNQTVSDTFTGTISYRNVFSADTLQIGGVGLSSNFHGYIKQILFFSTALPADTIALLSDNPYQLWQPTVNRFYSFAEEPEEPASLQPLLTNLNYKEKPKQFGPFSVVQGALRDNVERIGIDFEDVALAMPMWGPGDQQDYSKSALVGVNNGASFEKGGLSFDGSNGITAGQIASGLSDSFTFICKGGITAKPTDDVTTLMTSTVISYNNYYVMLGAFMNKWEFSMYDGSNNPRAISTENYIFGKNEILIGVRHKPDDKLYLYRNGEIQGSGTTDTTVATPVYSALTFGAQPTKSQRFLTGFIDMSLVLSKILNPSQIAHLSEDPYQLWQPTVNRYYSFAEAETGVSFLVDLNNVTLTSETEGFARGCPWLADGRIDADGSGYAGFCPIKLQTSLINDTLTSDITISIIEIINFILNHANTTLTSDIAALITRDLQVNLSNNTLISDITSLITRDLLVNQANTTLTSDIAALITRNLLANQASTTSTSDIAALITRELQVSLSNDTIISNIIVSIIRELQTNLSNDTSTADIIAFAVRELQFNLINNSLTSDIAINMAGIISFILDHANNTLTSDIAVLVVRELQLNLTNITSTPDISVLITRALQASFSNNTLTSDIAVLIDRTLQVNLANITLTPDIVTSITRELSVNLTNITLTSDIATLITRALQIDLANNTLTSNIIVEILGIISFILDQANTTLTSDIDFLIDRTLQTNIANTTSTSDLAIMITRALQISLANTSLTSNIGYLFVRKLLVNIANTTGTSDIAVLFARALSVNISNDTETSEISINITGVISFLLNHANDTNTSDITTLINRLLTINLNNTTSTSTVIAINYFLRELLINLSNTTLTSDIDALINRSLIVDLANTTVTPDISTVILRLLLNNITNNTLTSEILLLLSSLGVVVCPSIYISDNDYSVIISD